MAFPRRLPLLALLLWAAPVAAQFRIDHFTTENGLPQNTVSAMAQTQDGYLWFTTFDGLVRYDGVRFTTFDRGSLPLMRRTQFVTLLPDASGALWAGSDQGMLRIRPGGRFDWISADTVPAARHHEALPAAYPGFARDGLHNGTVDSLLDFAFTDRRGVRWTPAERGQVLRRGVNGEERLTLDPDGREPVRIAGEDRGGAVWLYDPRYLFRFEGPRVTRFSGDSLFQSRYIRSALVDRDGILWVGTNDRGLYRVALRFLEAYSVEQGLPQRVTYPVLADPRGGVWVGAGNTLSRVGVGPVRAQEFVRERGHLRLLALHTRGAFTTEEIRSLALDPRGGILVGFDDGMASVRDGRVVREWRHPFGGLTGLTVDRAGDIWAGGQSAIFRIRGDSIVTFATDRGVPPLPTFALLQDHAGVIWAATHVGLYRLDGDHFVADSATRGEHTRSLYESPDGALWVGTADHGLWWLHGRAVHLTTNEGLFSNGVFQILDDGIGRFWISCNQGIYRVRTAELQGVIEGRSRRVSSDAFGRSDGMLTVEADGGRQPAGARSTDGRLWFPTQDGVVAIDPSLLGVNTDTPPVAIEEVAIDGVPVAPGDGLVLPPGATELEIHYTAPTSRQAAQVQFRYRLRGLDPAWSEAGTRREVHFSHLPAGSYTFEVLAGNSDGVWDSAGAAVRVEVRPYFWQTTWFRALAPAALIALLTGGLLLRVRFLQAQERRLTALVAERTAELERANVQLTELAIKDGLTGLANHRRFNENLQLEWQRSRREQSSLALLLLDIDHFKAYNDTYGHPAGDACLRKVGDVLASAVHRGTDLAARHGGEEFAVILPGATEEGARSIAERIRAEVRGLAIPHAGSGVAKIVTVSVGVVATVATEEGSVAGLIEEADRALYEAKGSGRDRVAVARTA